MKFDKFLRLGMATLAVVVPSVLYVGTQAATEYVQQHPLELNQQNQTKNYLLDDVNNYQVGSIKDKRETLKVAETKENNNYFRLK